MPGPPPSPSHDICLASRPPPNLLQYEFSRGERGGGGEPRNVATHLPGAHPCASRRAEGCGAAVVPFVPGIPPL